MGLLLGHFTDERTYLTYQKEFEGSELVSEARRVLDIIDTKSQSLLAYISISFAALIFLIAALPNSSNLRLAGLGRAVATSILLAIILALVVAIVLSLSCLNIVGAHTIGKLKHHKSFMPQDYEELIIRVTCYRRNRYLIAHRISLVTTTLTGLLFLDLLIASIINISHQLTVSAHPHLSLSIAASDHHFGRICQGDATIGFAITLNASRKQPTIVSALPVLHAVVETTHGRTLEVEQVVLVCVWH
jgi:hypothetical protein